MSLVGWGVPYICTAFVEKFVQKLQMNQKQILDNLKEGLLRKRMREEVRKPICSI